MTAAQATTVPTECATAARRRRFFRPRRLLIGGIAAAAVSAAAIAGSRHYDVGPFRNTFKAGLAALDRGDYALVRRSVRELQTAQPSSPRARFLRGAMLLEKGRCYPALADLEQAKQDAGLETAAQTLMGEAWYRLGRHVEAQAALEQVLKQEPDSVEAHRWLAASYFDLGVVAKAVEHLHRTAELDPADPRPHRLLGLMYKDNGYYEEAIPFYEESLRRESDQPNAAEIRQELATCQVENQSYGAALATLEKCSDQAEFDVLRAKCHHAQGHFSLAKAALDRALEKERGNLEGLLLRGTMSLEDGDARAAIEALRFAVQAQPQDYTAHVKLAQAYDMAGERDLTQAERQAAEKIRLLRHEFAQLHRAAADRPRDIEVRLRLAQLAGELGHPELADVWLRAAAALEAAAQTP